MYNAEALEKHIEKLIYRCEEDENRFLDIYLSSLLSLVYKSKEKTPTYELFGELFENSFKEIPIEYNTEWDQYSTPPFENYVPDPDDFENSLINSETGDKVTKFEVLEKTIIFQITSLAKMDYNIENDIPSEEVEWKNLNVKDYLKASTYLLDYSETECDWLTLTDMLEYGRTNDINYM